MIGLEFVDFETVRKYHFTSSREIIERQRVPKISLLGTWVWGWPFFHEVSAAGEREHQLHSIPKSLAAAAVSRNGRGVLLNGGNQNGRGERI